MVRGAKINVDEWGKAFTPRMVDAWHVLPRMVTSSHLNMQVMKGNGSLAVEEISLTWHYFGGKDLFHVVGSGTF